MITVETSAEPKGGIVKSSGASQALTGQSLAVSALKSADIVIDLSVEGLMMHAAQTAEILATGTHFKHFERTSRRVNTLEYDR